MIKRELIPYGFTSEEWQKFKERNMRFINCTHQEIITRAIAAAEAHLTPDSYIMTLVAQKNDWKYGVKETGKEIVAKLCATPKEPVKVFTYRPWNRWTSAIAYYDGKAIHFNIRRLSDDIGSIVATLLHEYGHHVGYSHGNNYKTKDKMLFSLPYFLSENV